MKIKHLFFISFFLGLSSFVLGQEYAIDKGATFIAGMGSFISQGGDLFEDSDNKRINLITFSPSVNHFIAKNLFIGGGFEFSKQVQGNSAINALGIGPNFGYAIGNSNSTVFPYLDAGLRYYRKSMGKINPAIVSGTDIFLGFGVLIPIKTHIGLAVEGTYHMMNLKVKESGSSSSGNIISIGIGIVGLLF
jgi:hypothetical protein